MTQQFSDPDIEYARLLSKTDKTSAISFLRMEANSFINIKQYLSSCKNDEDFRLLLPQMLEELSHIRTSKISYLNRQFCFYDFTARKYLKKLLAESGRQFFS